MIKKITRSQLLSDLQKVSINNQLTPVQCIHIDGLINYLNNHRFTTHTTLLSKLLLLIQVSHSSCLDDLLLEIRNEKIRNNELGHLIKTILCSALKSVIYQRLIKALNTGEFQEHQEALCKIRNVYLTHKNNFDILYRIHELLYLIMPENQATADSEQHRLRNLREQLKKHSELNGINVFDLQNAWLHPKNISPRNAVTSAEYPCGYYVMQLTPDQDSVSEYDYSASNQQYKYLENALNQGLDRVSQYIIGDEPHIPTAFKHELFVLCIYHESQKLIASQSDETVKEKVLGLRRYALSLESEKSEVAFFKLHKILEVFENLNRNPENIIQELTNCEQSVYPPKTESIIMYSGAHALAVSAASHYQRQIPPNDPSVIPPTHAI